MNPWQCHHWKKSHFLAVVWYLTSFWFWRSEFLDFWKMSCTSIKLPKVRKQLGLFMKFCCYGGTSGGQMGIFQQIVRNANITHWSSLRHFSLIYLCKSNKLWFRTHRRYLINEEYWKYYCFNPLPPTYISQLEYKTSPFRHRLTV